MGRIRSIKPEFPQNEKIGRLSLEARLLFIQIWTIADDEGRARAAPRMLASFLYPYDDDVAPRIGAWLDELSRERCIVRYEADGNHYLQVVGWLEHQKIERPTPSRIPPAPSVQSREDSGALADDSPKPHRSLTEASVLDMDQGSGIGIRIEEGSARPNGLAAAPPSWAVEVLPGSDPPIEHPTPFGPDPEPIPIGEPPAVHAAMAPLSIRDALWQQGAPIVRDLVGLSERQSRAFLGRLLRESRDDCAKVLEALREAEDLRPIDPRAWLMAAASAARERPSKHPYLLDIPIDPADREAIEAGFRDAWLPIAGNA